MEMFCDLHAHSYYSDGSYSPLQLVEEAERIGLAAVVLSDHNTVEGLPEFVAASQGREVEAVPGIEFSSDYKGTELHILGLYIQPQYYREITEMLADAKRRKEQSNLELVQALSCAGYEVDYAAIKAATKDGFVNRAHIATAMTERGYTETPQEAFEQFLHPSRGYYIPPKRMDAFDVIRYFKRIGAVTVLAHPFLSLDEASLRAFLSAAVDCGLDAMETLYPRYDAQVTALAFQIADEFGLLYSGGSDFHGVNKPDIQLGSGRGELAVPVVYLEKMRERAGI